MLFEDHNSLINNDIGIVSKIQNLPDALDNYVNNSILSVFSDSTTGGILFNVKYTGSDDSPFFQHVFGETCSSREQQPVKDLFLKVSLLIKDGNNLNKDVKFNYVNTNTNQIKTVRLFDIYSAEIEKEFNIHSQVFNNNLQNNVEKWINVPYPLYLLLLTDLNSKNNKIAQLISKCDDNARSLLEAMHAAFIENDRCHLSLYFMEKVDAIPLGNVTVSNVLYTQPQYVAVAPNQIAAIPVIVPLEQKTSFFGKVFQTIGNLLNITGNQLTPFSSTPQNLNELAIEFYHLKRAEISTSESNATQQNDNLKKQMRINQIFIYELYKLFDHGNGFIHCDIHYENVLYNENNNNPIVYLIDFGHSQPCSYFREQYDHILSSNVVHSQNMRGQEYLYQYFNNLLPQIDAFNKKTNGFEKLRVSLVKMLLLNYVGNEWRLRSRRRMFSEDYLQNVAYQWFFYCYVKPLFAVMNIADAQINFYNDTLDRLVQFIGDRQRLDTQISLNFYCDDDSRQLCSPNVFCRRSRTKEASIVENLTKRRRIDKYPRRSLGGSKKRHQKTKKNRHKRKH